MAMIRRTEQKPKVWSPVRDIEDLERYMDRHFGNLFDFWSLPALWSRAPFEVGFFTPQIELIDHADKYTLRAELPGMKLSDIDVSVADNILTISGEKKHDATTKEEDYLYREH